MGQSEALTSWTLPGRIASHRLHLFEGLFLANEFHLFEVIVRYAIYKKQQRICRERAGAVRSLHVQQLAGQNSSVALALGGSCEGSDFDPVVDWHFGLRALGVSLEFVCFQLDGHIEFAVWPPLCGGT